MKGPLAEVEPLASSFALALPVSPCSAAAWPDLWAVPEYSAAKPSLPSS